MRVLLSFLIFITITQTQASDSARVYKPRKLSIEAGYNTMMLFSKNVRNDFENEFIHRTGVTNLGIGYQFSNNFKSFLSYSFYVNRFKNKEFTRNTIGYISAYQISTGIQKTMVLKGKFQFFGTTSLNWRSGFEFLVDGHNVENNHYNSFGLGLGGGINYRLAQRINLGLDAGYYHFFEKKSDLDEMQPHRVLVENMLIGNFKIGFLL